MPVSSGVMMNRNPTYASPPRSPTYLPGSSSRRDSPRRSSPREIEFKRQERNSTSSSPGRPSLKVEPASPSSPISIGIPPPYLRRIDSDFETSENDPIASTSFVPKSPLASPGGLAARRKLNKKQLSLVVPGTTNSTTSSGAGAPLTPVSPSLLRAGAGGTGGGGGNGGGAIMSDLGAETRSLPPSPVSLVTYIGVEGSEQSDRTIGRLMFKQQADEMREQMKGGRGMKRRTSIPRLRLGTGNISSSLRPSLQTSKTAPVGSFSGSAVQLIRRDAVERSVPNGQPEVLYGKEGDEGGNGVGDDEDGGDEVTEEYPYALGPREIIPGIWLGSEQNARDPQVLSAGNFGWVLNVAKEVDCPWTSEENLKEDEVNEVTPTGALDKISPTTGISDKVETPTVDGKEPNRRTQPQALATVASPEVERRPPLIRPTASTPNLQALYISPQPASPSPPAPELPGSILDALKLDSPTLSRSSSKQARSSRPSSMFSKREVSLNSSIPVHFPANSRLGRPPIQYLWLRWGHDESDLVEALKFQSAFDFLDRARASENGQGRVLVHCQCGVSRSATVVIAYCMREAAKGLESGQITPQLSQIKGMHDAYSFVKEKSQWVGPNLSLCFQLVAYEKVLAGCVEPEDDRGLYRPIDKGNSNDAAGSHLHSPRTPILSEGSTTSGSQLSTPEMSDPIAPVLACTAASPTLHVYGAGYASTVLMHGARQDETETLDLNGASRNGGLDQSSFSTESGGHTYASIRRENKTVKNFSRPSSHLASTSSTTTTTMTTSSSSSSLPPSILVDLDQSTGERSDYSTTGNGSSSEMKTSQSARVLDKAQSSRERLSLISRSDADQPFSPSPLSPVEGSRTLFGVQQSAQERRASHRRVFSTDNTLVPNSVKVKIVDSTNSTSSSPLAPE